MSNICSFMCAIIMSVELCVCLVTNHVCAQKTFPRVSSQFELRQEKTPFVHWVQAKDEDKYTSNIFTLLKVT